MRPTTARYTCLARKLGQILRIRCIMHRDRHKIDIRICKFRSADTVDSNDILRIHAQHRHVRCLRSAAMCLLSVYLQGPHPNAVSKHGDQLVTNLYSICELFSRSISRIICPIGNRVPNPGLDGVESVNKIATGDSSLSSCQLLFLASPPRGVCSVA